MARKDVSVRVILECTSCCGINKELLGVSRYITQKNRHTSCLLELKKNYCYWHKYIIHEEIKK